MVNKSWSQNSQWCCWQAKGRVPHMQWRSMAFWEREKNRGDEERMVVTCCRLSWKGGADDRHGISSKNIQANTAACIHTHTHTHTSKCLFPNTHPDCVWTQSDEHTHIKDTHKLPKPDIVFVICLFSLNCLVPSLWPNYHWWLNLHFGCSSINSSKLPHYLCSFTWQTQDNKFSLSRSVQELMNFTICTINTQFWINRYCFGISSSSAMLLAITHVPYFTICHPR